MLTSIILILKNILGKMFYFFRRVFWYLKDNPKIGFSVIGGILLLILLIFAFRGCESKGEIESDEILRRQRETQKINEEKLQDAHSNSDYRIEESRRENDQKIQDLQSNSDSKISNMKEEMEKAAENTNRARSRNRNANITGEELDRRMKDRNR